MSRLASSKPRGATPSSHLVVTWRNEQLTVKLRRKQPAWKRIKGERCGRGPPPFGPFSQGRNSPRAGLDTTTPAHRCAESIMASVRPKDCTECNVMYDVQSSSNNCSECGGGRLGPGPMKVYVYYSTMCWHLLVMSVASISLPILATLITFY